MTDRHDVLNSNGIWNYEQEKFERKTELKALLAIFKA